MISSSVLDSIECCLKDATTMSSASFDSLVMWAPNSSLLGSLLKSYAKYVASTEDPWLSSVVFPIPLPFGCATRDDTLDLQSHPLFGKQWAPLVRSQSFIDQELKVVLPKPSTLPLLGITWRLSH